ncbi:thioesterase family protein [Rhodococcus sp. D2-41]|uniref:thioesterase family protein n=1 Tax=Speluncibacter jeojiensis TaxID=2710754 RepID=UPI00240F3088|nr:thioesterase family protein [Rhodococcus sp. D2-41]MDG3012769.1 thioesterase family protein [Rhodococcus sp. D2-41]
MRETTGRPSAYFERVADDRLVPTVHAGGAWSDDEQHFSPVGGLLVHEIDRHRAREGRPALPMGRVSFDILGRIGFEEFEVEVETVRPGRTIELVQATMLIGGRSVVTARAWFLATLDTEAVAVVDAGQLPGPESAEPWPLSSVWSGGYIASLDTRRVGQARPGRGTVWASSRVDLVAGERAGATASFVALVDTANGIAVRQDPAEWMFPNLDLTIHLFRQPEGEWTGLDTTVTFGGSGQGLTSTVLHDVRGPVGSAQQILTVRPQPATVPAR